MSTISKVDILAIGAHPDDVEMGAGGALAKQIRLGRTVGILDLTRGELGTRGTPELRRKEAVAAAEILRVQWRKGLDLGDGFFEISQHTIQEVATIIRLAQPSIILTNAVRDRHPDHGRAAELTKRAMFIAGVNKVSLDHNGTALPRWRTRNLYYYIQDYNLDPDIILAIEAEDMVLKKESILAFRSQFYNPASTELSTPLTTPFLIDQLEGRCRSWGRQINAEYGEGFVVERFVGVNDLFDLL